MHQAGHHGSWTVQVLGLHPAHQEQVALGLCITSCVYTPTHAFLGCMPFLCRFGSGYTLQFKVSNNAIAEPVESSLQTVSMGNSVPLRSLESVDTTRIKQFVAETFPGAVLTEEHQVGVCLCVGRDCCGFKLF